MASITVTSTTGAPSCFAARIAARIMRLISATVMLPPSMVLLDAQRIVIVRRQIRLKVLLDVVSRAKLIQHGDHAMGIILPVSRLGHG